MEAAVRLKEGSVGGGHDEGEGEETQGGEGRWLSKEERRGGGGEGPDLP